MYISSQSESCSELEVKSRLGVYLREHSTRYEQRKCNLNSCFSEQKL